MEKIIPRMGIKKKKSFKKSLLAYRWMYVMILPVLVYFGVFHYAPMYGIQLAFKQFNFNKGIWGSDWVGLYNFKRLFNSNTFWSVFRNTLQISVKKLIFGFPAPIILALAINEVRCTWFKKTFQTISYMPHFFSWVILGGIFTQILSPSYGVINYLITLFGGKPIYFLAEPSMFQGILVTTGIWAGIGWGSIIYLAAITGVDEQLYEAAAIDGAGRWRCTWNITLPSILPIVSMMFILGLSGILNVGFDQVFNLYNPTVYSTGDVIDTYVYRVGLVQMSYEFSTAVGLFKNVIGVVLVVGSNILIRMFSKENALW